MSLMTPIGPSSHRVAVGGRIAPGRIMVELTLDVGKKAARADAEEIGLHPRHAELLLHEDKPGERILGRAQAACRLEPDVNAGALTIIAERPEHHEAHRKSGVEVLLRGGRLEEVGARL